MLDGYFAKGPEGLIPRSHARSPWSDDMIHGRLFAALAAREVERRHLEGGLRIARLTADLFRATPMVPLTLRATRIRDGRRVRLVDVDVVAEGRPAARVGVLLAAAQGTPPGHVWGQGIWDLLPPDGREPPASDRAGTAGYPELHFESAGLGDTSGPLRAWLRDRWPLVDGEELTPAQRAVLASDLANPLSNWGIGDSITSTPTSRWRWCAHRGASGSASRSSTTSTVTGSRSEAVACTTSRGPSATVSWSGWCTDRR